MILGEKLKMSRKRKGYSQGEVAEKLHISRQTVSKWETGQNLPDVDKLTELAELYAVSVAFLLDKNQNEPETCSTVSGADVIVCSEVPEELPEEKALPQQPVHHTEPEMLESLLLMILAILSCVIPIFGLAIPPIILYFNKKIRKLYWLVFIVAVFCFLYNLYNSLFILNEMFFHIGFNYTVELIE